MSAVARPVLRYHGGKWRLAPWVIEHLPQHRIYVEPYGGAASVLMRKPPSDVEIYNDMDDDVVCVFRVLRDETAAAKLRDLVSLTPYSRSEFFAAYEDASDVVERARRTIIRAFMGFGSTTRRRNRTGFRGKGYISRSPTEADWARYPDAIPHFVTRLRGVLVENRPAIELIETHDGPETLFYVDPPYPHATRSSIRCTGDLNRAYQHEMTDEDHRELAAVLHDVEGMVVLSGYRGDLYEELYPDWVSHDRDTLADGARPRTETLWLNPAAAAAQDQLRLFPSPTP